MIEVFSLVEVTAQRQHSAPRFRRQCRRRRRRRRRRRNVQRQHRAKLERELAKNGLSHPLLDFQVLRVVVADIVSNLIMSL